MKGDIEDLANGTTMDKSDESENDEKEGPFDVSVGGDSVILSNYQNETLIVSLDKSPLFSGSDEKAHRNIGDDDEHIIITFEGSETTMPVLDYEQTLEAIKEELHR